MICLRRIQFTDEPCYFHVPCFLLFIFVFLKFDFVAQNNCGIVYDITVIKTVNLRTSLHSRLCNGYSLVLCIFAPGE